MVCVVEKPCERFNIKSLCLERNAESDVIAVKIKRFLVKMALEVRVMVAVVAYYKYKVFERRMPERKMPVEFSPPSAIIMSDKLAEETRVSCEKNAVLKSIVPSVFRAAEVVIAWEGTWGLELYKVLSMDEYFMLLR